MDRFFTLSLVYGQRAYKSETRTRAALTYFLIFFANEVKSLSRVQLFSTPWAVAHQAPASMEFSRPEYWNGLPFPSPGDLPDPGINLGLLHCRQILFKIF